MYNQLLILDSKKLVHHKMRRLNKNLVDVVFKLENVSCFHCNVKTFLFFYFGFLNKLLK